MRRLLKPRPVIVHEGHELPYELVRRPRVTRGVYLELGDNGGLRVVAPKHLSAREVHRLLEQKPWAPLQFLEGALQKKRARPVFHYRPGEKHLYQGWWYPLCFLEPGEIPPDGFDGKEIVLRVRSMEPESVRDTLRKWYRARAAEHFAKRLAHFCALAPWANGQPVPLRLRRMKRTLGSCSREGRITLNPHLIKAPPFLIDSIVAHEVCHLEEHNHGKGFYALMDQLFPEWRAARKHLRADWHLYLAE